MKRERALQALLVVVGLLYSFLGLSPVRQPVALHVAERASRRRADVPQTEHGAWGLSVAGRQAPGEASLRDRLWGLVKPWPRVHHDNHVGAGRGAWDAQEG